MGVITTGKQMSKIEDDVINLIKMRAIKGENKYKTTMERTDLSLLDWVIHAQEEAMDLAVYLERIKQELKKPLYDEDAVNKRMNIIGRNGPTGEHYE